MIVGHISDAHDDLMRFLPMVCTPDVDVIVLSGDCLPEFYQIDDMWSNEYFAIQTELQDEFLWNNGKNIKTLVGDRPVITVQGNHDYTLMAPILGQFGVNIHELTESRPCVTVRGKRWAGFREIPYIGVGFPGETRDMYTPMDRAYWQKPDILVTHAPPAGIFDSSSRGSHYGSIDMLEILTKRPHHITHHFFGHVHEKGGNSGIHHGILFANGARHAIKHHVPD